MSEKITRIEVIDENGRSYVNWDKHNVVSYQLQDDGKTLKVFVNKTARTLKEIFLKSGYLQPNQIEDLIDQIEVWLPREQSAAGSQRLEVEMSVEGYNDCLNEIKRKLR